MNSVEIQPITNMAEIKPIINTMIVSLFDVYTTTYFLTESVTLEEHEEAGSA